MRKSTVTLLLALFSIVNLAAQVNLSNGLVAYYPFNGNANDESGNGHHGTIIGGNISQDRNNQLSALSLSGVNSYVDMDWDGKIGSGFESFTIAFWFKTNKLGTSIIRNGHYGPTSGYLFQVTSANKLSFALGGFPNYSDCFGFVTSSTGFNDNNWRLVTITVDRTSNKSKLYLNGESIQIIKNPLYAYSGTVIENGYTYDFGNLPTLSTESSLLFNLGSLNKGTEFFSGSLDDVRIYNRVLNQAEIQALYTENQPVDLQNGLVAYYPFNGNANDESGNGNNGTITGPNFINDRLGKSSSAIEVDRTSFISGSGYVTSNSMVGNIGTSDFTFSVWFNPNDLSNSQYILAKRQNGLWGNQVDLAFDSNKLHLEISESDLNYIDIHGNTFISTNAWHHAVVLRKSNIAYIYVDGQLDVNSIVGTINVNNNFPFTIGVNKETPSSPFGFFNGFIDEVRIYNRALNDAEIKALYEECSSISAPSIAITSNKLNTTSLAGFNYQWYLNESTISGANSNVLNDPLQIGVYKVKAKTGSCEAISLPFNIGSFPNPATISGIQVITVVSYKIIVKDENGNIITGMVQRKENQNVSIYPNPSKGVFRIESNLVPIEKIEVFNLQGIKVYDTKEKEINIKGMPNGNYLIKIFDPDVRLIETRKMLIE